ncbi:hCG2004350, isoform CRA_f, partial [Homo sapiens]
MSNPFLKQVFNKDKTFRPKRKFEPGTQRFELHKKAQASLNAGLDLRLAVQLPPGEDLNDWVAVHVVDFFNRVNLIYGTISDGCTEQSCPVMSGGPKYEYRWQDEHKFRKPTALSAPRYMDLLMDWIEAQINNEDLFPTNVAENDRISIRPGVLRRGDKHPCQCWAQCSQWFQNHCHGAPGPTRIITPLAGPPAQLDV